MERRAAALVVLGAVLWGTTGTAQALGRGDASPLSVGAVRLLVGAAGLILSTRARWSPPPWGWTAMAAAAMAVYQLAFFAGVARAGVALGTMVSVGIAPVVAGVTAWLVRGERPGPTWMAATPLAVAGVVLIAGRVGPAADPVGVYLAVLAGIAYAVYVVASKYLVESMAPVAAMAVVFTVAAAAVVPLLPGADLGWLTRPRGVAAAVWLGLGATTAAYAAFATGLRHTPAGTAATLTLAEPATAALLGVALLGERPPLVAWLGMGLVVAALGLIARRLPPAHD